MLAMFNGSDRSMLEMFQISANLHFVLQVTDSMSCCFIPSTNAHDWMWICLQFCLVKLTVSLINDEIHHMIRLNLKSCRSKNTYNNHVQSSKGFTRSSQCKCNMLTAILTAHWKNNTKNSQTNAHKYSTSSQKTEQFRLCFNNQIAQTKTVLLILVPSGKSESVCLAV